jgi:hypothetical protein
MHKEGWGPQGARGWFVKGAMAMGIPLITEMNFTFGTDME